MKLALCLAASLVVATAHPGPDPPADTDAAELLEKAETRASQGKFKEAQRLYRKLAKDHAGTPEGRIGERRGRPSAYLGHADVVRHGDSGNRVDIVLMGEGYQLNEMKAFAKLADDVPDYFRRNRTLGEYYTYFNFLRADLVSADNGVDGYGREYDTALNGRTLGTYAGHVGVDRGAVQRMLAEMPSHDGQAIVFAKLGILGTGGGGVATIGGRSMATMIHEFGHSFGRLSDEYSTETHKRGELRRNVNVTNDPDPEKAPWKHWIEARARGVGMYEGAGGQVRGAWRPTNLCTMASGEFFCPVCREQLVLLIYSMVDPIDAATPEPHPIRGTDDLEMTRDGLQFEVTAMQPAHHKLHAAWWIVPEAEAPRERIGSTNAGPYDARRRTRQLPGKRDPGKLKPIGSKPVRTSRGKKDGVHDLRITPNQLEPGRYRVICRITDTAEVKGSKLPWVLKDERGLLESEVGWWITVPER